MEYNKSYKYKSFQKCSLYNSITNLLIKPKTIRSISSNKKEFLEDIFNDYKENSFVSDFEWDEPVGLEVL